MNGLPVVEYVGADLPGASYWYWSWGARPQVHVVTASDRSEVQALLADALPTERAYRQLVDGWRPGARLPESVRTASGALQRSLVPLQRLITGPLADPRLETAFSAGLRDALLPPTLAAEVLGASSGGHRVEFRVRPAPSAGAVPWELLPLAPGIRLVDVADIVTVPAPLTRESRMPGDSDQPRTWDERRHQPVLRVIDPDAGSRVFAPWQQWPRADNGVTVLQPEAWDRLELSRILHNAPSRLLYVGHVDQPTPDAKSVSMRLGCRRDVFGYREVDGAQRPFSAEDLARGTIGYADAVGAASAAARDASWLVPDVARVGGTVVERPGAELWPMPPRVALIACASGGDLAESEPFGLVSAVLDAGAELVTATRWTLPSDTVWRLFGASGAPMREAVLEIDRIQASEDPVRELGQWQRARLDRWRASGRVEDAPLLWASFTHHDGRYRRRSLPAPPE